MCNYNCGDTDGSLLFFFFFLFLNNSAPMLALSRGGCKKWEWGMWLLWWKKMASWWIRCSFTTQMVTWLKSATVTTSQSFLSHPAHWSREWEVSRKQHQVTVGSWRKWWWRAWAWIWWTFHFESQKQWSLINKLDLFLPVKKKKL